MQSNLEKWLKENGVNFFCGRELKTPAEITLRCSALNWDEIKIKYDLAVKSKQFTPVERYVMSFILCELKGLALTEEMLAPDYDDKVLSRDQISALSLFELVDTPTDEMSKVTPADVLAFISTHVMSVRSNVEQKKDASAKQILNDLRNNYYYLLQIIHKKIKILGHYAAAYQEDEESAPNDADSYHSNDSNSIFPNVRLIPVLSTLNKPNIDVNSIKIVLPVHKENSSKTSGFRSFFSWLFPSTYSWSNIFYKTNFYDNAEDKKSSDSTKQAVKDAYHDYVSAVNELAENIELFNKKGLFDLDLSKILVKYNEALGKKLNILDCVKKSRDEIYFKSFNEDLFSFYKTLENELKFHESALELQFNPLLAEYTEMQHIYEQFTNALEGEYDIDQKVTQLIELIKNKRIYKNLPDMLNENGIIKLKFLAILKKALVEITQQARVSNVSTYQQYYEPMHDLIADLASRIDPSNALVQQVQNDKFAISTKMSLVESYTEDFKEHIESLAKNKNPDINTFAAKLIVAEQHALVSDDSSYQYLRTCYQATDWWRIFDSKYQGLKKLLEGKAVINIDKAVAQLKDLPNADVFLLSLKEMCTILADDYPETAPNLSQTIEQIRTQRNSSPEYTVVKFIGAVWAFVPTMSSSKTVDNTHEIFSAPSFTGV
jgi:hypothetical protein